MSEAKARELLTEWLKAENDFPLEGAFKRSEAAKELLAERDALAARITQTRANEAAIRLWEECGRELAASRERERALRGMFKDGYVLALYDDHGSQVNAWHSPEEFIATIATPDSAAPTGEAK